ncbi:MAG: adenylate/guanylate cyclase domain-containing protein [Ferruginibacter sp.]
MAKYSMDYFVKATATLLLCLNIYFTNAQVNEIDSLKHILTGSSSSEQATINYQIGSLFFSSVPDSAIYFYDEALKLSRALNNDTLAAKCLNRIGILNYNAGEYEKAIGNLFSALKIFEHHKDQPRSIRCLQYLGMAYNEQGMYDKAVDYAKQSLEISKSIGDKASTAVGMTNIGSVYYAQGNYDKALEYFQQGLHIMEEMENQQGIADGLNNVALIYEEKKNSAKALEFHLRSLALAKDMDERRGIAVSYHNIGRVYKTMAKFPIAIQYLDSCITLAKEGDDMAFLKDVYNTLSEVYSDMGNFEKAYQAHLAYSKLNDTLMNAETKRQFAEMNAKYETEKKDKQIGLLNKDKEIAIERMRKEKIIRYSLIGGFAIVLLFAGIFFCQRNKIKKGKQRSDELLLNILPSETAEELKSTGAAQAKHFDAVTVMFTDFKNFTQTSEQLSATELVQKIHHYYSEFDKIISRYGLEKIKTIGDSYMCAGGLPVPDNANAEQIVKAAFDICDFMKREKLKGKAEHTPYFEIRIGCHTGPVVAGIVGIKKFAYDIWGDTVNIASRMEQHSEAGKINISASTYELVKDKFNCTHRGKIQAKNKGEIDMYFVEGVAGKG